MSTPWGVLNSRDQILLSYYETVLCRMITTIDDDRNGFRHVLIKLALSENSASSEAVLQGILAFSAYHLSEGSSGIEHSFAATKALSASMRVATEPRDRLYQLAASMVLVTYGVSLFPSLLQGNHCGVFNLRARKYIRYNHSNVCSFAINAVIGADILLLDKVFNISESRWTTFFCGAKAIARSIFAGSQDYDGELAFLLDWVYGQDTLSRFSLLFWPQKDLDQRNCEKDPYLLSKVETSPHRNLVSLAPNSALMLCFFHMKT